MIAATKMNKVNHLKHTLILGKAMRLIRRTIAVFSMRRLFFLTAVQLVWGVPNAQSHIQSQEEVAHLLGYVEQSGCQFNRNGTWYKSHDAQRHLRKKYDYLDKRGLVPDAENFIEKAASQSSISGREYQVRCAGGKDVPSARWFSDELLRFRDGRKKQKAP